MKIGILTLPFNNNYGGLLQAYALQNYLKGRGHDVYSIQQSINKNQWVEIKEKLKNVLKAGNNTNSRFMQEFQHKNMQETIVVDSDKDFEKLQKYNFEAVIVGSDQVWRFNYIRENYKRYFLDFIKNDQIKKISYAASFGVDFWEADEDQTKNVTELIGRFDSVSVREKSGVHLCEEKLNYSQAQHLLDPVLLFPADFYRNLYKNENNDSAENKLGYYLLDFDNQKKELVALVEGELNLEAQSIGKTKNVSKFGIETKYPPVYEWIRGFATSDFIVTDSFHGMLFSVIFEKPFIIIGNKTRGLSRFNSFLEMVNLKDRLIDINNYSQDTIKEQ